MKKQRKGSRPLADRKVLICFTKEEYDELQALLKISKFNSMSGMVRHIIEGKGVVATHYESTFDNQLEEIEKIHKDLHILRVEMDQSSKSFYFQQPPEAMLTNAQIAAFIYEQVGHTIEPLYALITEISKKWLPA
ncbi:MAG TPA: hypothetical protein VL053_05690 [Arachidicoccus sp.]|nr:hypothetical protein [Arachidicoccus sp.]